MIAISYRFGWFSLFLPLIYNWLLWCACNGCRMMFIFVSLFSFHVSLKTPILISKVLEFNSLYIGCKYCFEMILEYHCCSKMDLYSVGWLFSLFLFMQLSKLLSKNRIIWFHAHCCNWTIFGCMWSADFIPYIRFLLNLQNYFAQYFIPTLPLPPPPFVFIKINRDYIFCNNT